jgi:hypothetical protein
MLRGVAALSIFLISVHETARAQIQIFPGQTPAGVEQGNNYLPLAQFTGPLSIGADELLPQFLQFPFLFEGTLHSEIGIASNGYITIGTSGNGSETNQHFPDPAVPNGVLAPFWADLDPTAPGAAVYFVALTDGVNIWNVVDWENVPDARNHNFRNNFEIWLGTANFEDVTFGYGNFAGTADGSGTVGAENISGTDGANYYYNGTGTLPKQGDGLRVVSSPVSVLPEPTSFTLMTTGLGIMAVAIRRRRKRVN